MFLAMEIGIILGSSIVAFIIGMVLGIAAGYLYWGKPHDG